MGASGPTTDELRARFARAVEQPRDAEATRLLDRVRAAVRGDRPKLGRYELHDRIGRGGFGEVFDAFDPTLGRRVALKVLQGVAVADELRQEARALAAVRHPNVVEVFEVGATDSGAYVAMERVEGSDLAHWLESRQDGESILRVLIEAATGLAAVHHAGLVHADFKPSNVLVGVDGRVRIVDFGLARAHAASGMYSGVRSQHDLATAPAVIGGTLPYMAPELHRGGQPTVRSDVFALCATAFECLAGRRAYAQTSAFAAFEAKLAGLHTPWPNEVPTRLRRTIERGLAPHPMDRWPNAEAVIHAWRAATKPGPGLAIPSLAAAAVVAIAAWAGGSDVVDRCAVPVVPTWTEDLDAATGARDASATEARSLFDGRREQWRTAFAQACTLANTDARLDAIACLDHARAQGDAVVAAFDGDDHLQRVDPLLRGFRERVVPLQCVASELSRSDAPRDWRLAEDVAPAYAALEVGDLPRAHALAIAALGRADEAGDPRARAAALHVRGLVARDQSDLEAARDALQSAYWLATTADDDPLAALAASDLVLLAGAHGGDLEQAEHWRRLAEAALAHAPDATTTELRLVENLQHVFNEHGLGDRALAMAEREVALAEQLDDGHGLATLRARRHLVDALNLVGQHERARPIAEDVLAATIAMHGRRHVAVALAELAVGNVTLSLGEASVAEPHLRRALDLGRDLRGPDDPFNLTALQNLAMVVDELGRHADAVILWREAVALATASYGNDHARVAWTTLGLGQALLHTGALDESERTLHAALVAWTRLHGDSSLQTASCWSSLADVAIALGDHDAATVRARRAIEIAEATSGADHPMTAALVANLGHALAAAGDHANALTEFDGAIAVLDRAGVVAEAASARVWRAQSLFALGRVDDARVELHAAIEPLQRFGSQRLVEAIALRETLSRVPHPTSAPVTGDRR